MLGKFISSIAVICIFAFGVISLAKGAVGAVGGDREQADKIVQQFIINPLIPNHSGGCFNWFLAGFHKSDPKPQTLEQIQMRRMKLGY